MRSILHRLVLSLALGIAILIGGATWVLDHLLTRQATQEFDGALLVRVRTFAALTEDEAGKIELDYTPASMPEFERAERPEYFQFWLDDGKMLLRSKHLAVDLPRSAEVTEQAVIRDVVLPDGRSGRLCELRYLPRKLDASALAGAPAPRRVVVAVARGREPLDATIRDMRLAVVATGGGVLLLALLLVWRAVSSGLRPVTSIASQVAALDAGRLSARIAVADTPRELAPVVDRMNALLERLGEAFERERRFTGNVAHELRTPIAELRSLAQVAGRWPLDPAATARFFGDVGDVATRMEHLVADLLLLARCQAGAEATSTSPTEIRPLVSSAWSRLDAEAERARLKLSIAVPDDMTIDSDPQKLSVIFGNLLGNAVSYAIPGTDVRVSGERVGSRIRLVVENTANPLPPEDLARVTEPFWRSDASRSSPEHAGLGLALVAALADLLSLDVRFEQDRDGTFRASLEGRAFDASSVPHAAPA